MSLLPAPKTSSIDLDLEAQIAEESNIGEHQEGLAVNTQQDDQAESGGTDDNHGDEPTNEGERVTLTEIAEPQDPEESPSTTCRPSNKMMK